MSHFSSLARARKSLFTYSRNTIIQCTHTRTTRITTESTRKFSNNNNDDSDGNNDSTFISDNWSDPSQRSIKSVEELSEYGKHLLCGSLFTGNNKKANTEEIYGEWAENYEHDMDTLRFDSLATMPGKVEQYLTETLINNMDIPEEESQAEDANANILDVGCGTGLLGELLMENTDIIPVPSDNNNNVMIDGMDLTQEMLDILCKERGGLYNEVYQHDIEECPWPVESDKYDLSVCNGVLVYVKGSECLDEFIRVTKPGGYCLLMLRQDSLDQFSHKIYQLITDKKWQIAEITNTRYNFKAQVDNEKKYFVPYNHHIFTVL